MYLKRRRPLNGGLAQLGERLPCKQEVTGSIPVLSTREKELTEVTCNGGFIEFLWNSDAPWKLNIVIMMQLWEGNSKG